jgi:hypothetical protein
MSLYTWQEFFRILRKKPNETGSNVKKTTLESTSALRSSVGVPYKHKLAGSQLAKKSYTWQAPAPHCYAKYRKMELKLRQYALITYALCIR